jgi:hypothetical protein
MHYGVRSANVVSNNAQFSAAFKEQQAICRMFDHVQSNQRVAALAWYFLVTTCLIGAEAIAM